MNLGHPDSGTMAAAFPSLGRPRPGAFADEKARDQRSATVQPGRAGSARIPGARRVTTCGSRQSFDLSEYRHRSLFLRTRAKFPA